jgi:hypothetical protein
MKTNHALRRLTRPALITVLVASACSAMAAQRVDFDLQKTNPASFGGQTIHGISGLSADELKPINTSSVNGQNVTRFQQYYLGVPILGEAVVVKGTGNAATTKAASVSGAILKNVGQDLPSVRPTVTPQAALDQAKTLARTQQTSQEKINLYIKQGANGAAHLVYIVSFVNHSAFSPSQPVFMIDAYSGAVLDRWEGLDKRDGSGPGSSTQSALTALANTPGWNLPKAREFMRYANDIYWSANSDAKQGSCGAEKAALDLGYKVSDITAAFGSVGKCRSNVAVDLVGTTLAELSKVEEYQDYVYGDVRSAAKPQANTAAPGGQRLLRERATTKYAYGDWSRITRDDLSHMGSHWNSDFARGRFQAVMGSDKTPVNVDVNDVQLGSSGQNPNGQWGWYADKRLVGNGQISDIPGFNGWQHVNGYTVSIIRNYGKSVLNLPKDLFGSTATTQATNWSIAATAGVKIGGKVGIPLVTEGSVEVSFSVTGTGGGSTSTTITQPFYQPAISVPVGYEAVFELVERWRPVSAVWTVPIEVSGLVGADYGAGKWNGHYFWTLPATSYFYEYGNRPGAEKYTVYLNQKYGIEMVVRAYTRKRTG